MHSNFYVNLIEVEPGLTIDGKGYTFCLGKKRSGGNLERGAFQIGYERELPSEYASIQYLKL